MTRHRHCRGRRSARMRLRAPAVTLFLLVCLLAFDGTGVLRTGLLCAVLHESAHAVVFRKQWHRWPDLTLSPLGICLQLRGVPMAPDEELLLAAAGPLANLLASGTVLWAMQAVGHYSYAGYWFACTNLLVGGANLLPLPGLDGAHILHWLVYSLDKRRRI